MDFNKCRLPLTPEPNQAPSFWNSISSIFYNFNEFYDRQMLQLEIS